MRALVVVVVLSVLSSVAPLFPPRVLIEDGPSETRPPDTPRHFSATISRNSWYRELVPHPQYTTALNASDDSPFLRAASAAAPHPSLRKRVGTGSEQMLFDVDAQKIRYSFHDSSSGFMPGCTFNSTTTLSVDTEYLDQNEQCRVVPKGKFADIFNWVKYSHFVGTRTVNNQTCSLWELRLKDGSFNGTYCSNGLTPVFLTLLTYGAWMPGRAPSILNTTIVFLSYDPSPVPPEAFDVPDACLNAPPPCEGGAVIETDMYLAHPADNYNISGQDTADALGDTVFTCYDIRPDPSKQADNYTVVSWYRMRVLSSWGQYALCNGYDPSICIGWEEFFVGRESSMGCNPNGGQCPSTDPGIVDAGYWYSLPVKGECGEGKDIHLRECSWEIVERVKTITVECLFKTQGMTDACESEKSLPFTKAQSVFLRAFAESDVTKGGCPDIGPGL